jgi:hypothetical protein
MSNSPIFQKPDLTPYFVRAKTAYTLSFQNPDTTAPLEMLQQIGIELQEIGISSERISMLLSSAMNEVRQELDK